VREYFVWLAKFITIVVMFVVVVPILFAAVAVITAKGGDGVDIAKGVNRDHRVAVIELNGIIGETKELVEDLYKQVEDDRVKAIVLRIDSPGGAVGPSQDVYSAIQRLKTRKPIIASMGGVAASGGLYAAVGATKVFCQPGTITGSIGVIMQVPNFTKIADKVGLDMITIKAGRLKDVGNAFRSMSDEERAYLEDLAGKVHADFISAVADGRGIPREKVETFADGRIIIGSQAKEVGLIDEFGDVYDAARKGLELAHVELGPDELPYLYYPEGKFAELKKIFQSVATWTQANLPAKIQLQYLMQ
jgi:protease IV